MGFEIINKLKKMKRLTNAQLAEMSGVTLSTIDKITSGTNRNPKLDTLQAICKVLGCRLDDFDDTPEESPANPAAHSLLNSFHKLNDVGQAEAVKRVEELAEIPRYALDVKACDVSPKRQQAEEAAAPLAPEPGDINRRLTALEQDEAEAL